MASLSNLTDQQNLLLTQLSYSSDKLTNDCEGMTLEELLGTVTDARAKQTLEDLCAAGLGDLTIKGVGNDSITGFGAIAFTDSSGATGFSYRGTDGIHWNSLNDWGDNALAMITGTSPQTAEAEAFFDKYCDPSGNNYLYGHSKGGELSESVYVNNYNMIQGVHLLNPQPINPYSLTYDQLAAINSKKVDIVIVSGDYVWFLGSLPSYGNIRIINSNGGNSHLYDSIKDQFDENGELIPGKQPWWEYAAYFAISTITDGLQRSSAVIGFAYNCVVRVVDFVRDDLIPAAQEFVTWVADKVSAIGEKFKDFANELKNFLADTISKVTDWFKRNLNAAYSYANSYPDVYVDTSKLRDYASRLANVNRRISGIDGRLDGLYWKVGLLDLWNLMQADILTGYSWRLGLCSSYLNNTATWYENAEQEVMNNL